MSADFDAIYATWRQACERVGRLRVLFICGCAKSDTTWLVNMLNGHPAVTIQGEGCFTYQLLPALQQAFAAFNKHQQPQPDVTRLRDLDLALTLRTLIDSQLARYIEHTGKPADVIRVVGDKTPQHTVSLSVLAQICPAAQFVHILRYPRDVATSAWFHFGKRDSRSFEEYIRYYMTQVWPINVQHARQAGATLDGRYREVRYEDLLGNEQSWTRETLTWLGVDASDERVAQCVDAGSFQKRSGGRQRGQTDNNHFFRSGTTGDWRNHLPEELVASCCQPIAPIMQACGYDPHDIAANATTATS